MTVFCPLEMFLGIGVNEGGIFKVNYPLGQYTVGMADLVRWMKQPNVGAFNRPIVKVRVINDDLYFSTSLQLQQSKFVPGVGSVPLCKSLEGDRDFFGGGSPPPPRRKKECDCMDCGCSCNDIATMLARQLSEESRLFESLKDHIDRRVKEEIAIHAKQLEAMTVDLQPIMDRVNEVENNLWNGIRK